MKGRRAGRPSREEKSGGASRRDLAGLTALPRLRKRQVSQEEEELELTQSPPDAPRTTPSFPPTARYLPSSENLVAQTAFFFL